MTPEPPPVNVGPEPSSQPPPRIRVVDDDGHPALMVDGVVVSIAIGAADAPSGYWAAMLPDGSPRSALLLGLGGGTVAHLLNRRYPGIELIGVDSDQEVVDFAREQFGLSLPNLEIVVGDAFQYVAQCERRFDFVAVDLFLGYGFQHGAVSKPFLRQLKAMIGHRGEVAFNLFRDRRTDQRLARIGRVMRVYRVDRIKRNLVAHCRGY